MCELVKIGQKLIYLYFALANKYIILEPRNFDMFITKAWTLKYLKDFAIILMNLMTYSSKVNFEA